MSTPDTDPALDAGSPAAPKRQLGPSYYKLFSASTISNLGDGVGLIAYPWLASAVTRNPILIALVAVAQRLPWLVFTLPAGVITDRHDRRTLMIWSNTARTVLTLAVAFAVLNRQGTLPGPDVVADETIAIPTNMILYGVIILATLLMGIAEVLYDNSAQTFMPSIVHTEQLEKANGRMWSAELVTNTFIGPPLGALLIAVSFSLPFFADAASFAVSAALIALIPRGRPAAVDDAPERRPWRAEVAEGFRWLWHHELLRPMAIILGCLNALGMVTGSILILYGQEVLDTSPTAFAVLTTGGAIGGIIGGWTASSVSKRLGTGPSLWLTLITQRRHDIPGRPDELVAGGVVPVRRRDGRRRDVERDHREPAAVDHPRSPARPRQQRVPVLRLGHDADRLADRRVDHRGHRYVRLARAGAADAVADRRRGVFRAVRVRRAEADDGEDRGRPRQRHRANDRLIRNT